MKLKIKDYCDDISSAINSLENYNYLTKGNLPLGLSYARHAEGFTFRLETQNTEFICQIVLENYQKLHFIDTSTQIDDIDKFNLVNSFVHHSINGIIKAINQSTVHFNESIKYTSSWNPTLPSVLKSALELNLNRNIELLFILKSFQLDTDIEKHLNVESQKIFEIAESLGMKIKSRAENLKWYASFNQKHLNDFQSGKSTMIYHRINYLYTSVYCSEGEVEKNRNRINKIKEWKAFRPKEQKEHDLQSAQSEFKKALDDYEQYREETTKKFENEIREMHQEVEILEAMPKVSKADFYTESPSTDIEGLKEMIKLRVSEKIDKLLPMIEDPFDLLNITMVQNEFASTLESYRKQFTQNKEKLNLSDNQIEKMFKSIIQELHEKYFN